MQEHAQLLTESTCRICKFGWPGPGSFCCWAAQCCAHCCAVFWAYTVGGPRGRFGAGAASAGTGVWVRQQGAVGSPRLMWAQLFWPHDDEYACALANNKLPPCVSSYVRTDGLCLVSAGRVLVCSTHSCCCLHTSASLLLDHTNERTCAYRLQRLCIQRCRQRSPVAVGWLYGRRLSVCFMPACL
jgi:hypothetical protein